MKNIKLFAAAILLIVLALAATYTINAYTNSAVQTTADVYTCPMHPEVIQDSKGTCPKCGMDLVLKDEKKENSGNSAMDCCKDSEKCKDMGCEMDKCKEHEGACSEECMKNADSKKDIKMDNDMKMDHSKCGKKGSCCGS